MNVLQNGEILLYGTVGMSFWDDGFTATDVIEALAELGPAAPVTVRINSGGGIATEGVAICSILKAHAAPVTVVVDAIAASAASIIAMAGDTVHMREGSLLMIHDPACITVGDAEDHQKSLNMLDKVGDSMASIYAGKTGKPVEQIRTDMKAELWLTADEAVAAGYADQLDQEQAKEPTAFAYGLYGKAPERIVALAKARAWTAPGRTAATAAANRQQENDMPNAPAAETAATAVKPEDAATANAQAIAAAASAQVTATQAAAADIAALCAEAGVPAMAAGLIKSGASLADAKARIDGAKEVRAAVELAHRQNPLIEASLADTYIAAGTSIEGVRADLFDRLARAQSPEIITAHQAGGGGGGAPAAAIDSAKIYALHNKGFGAKA